MNCALFIAGIALNAVTNAEAVPQARSLALIRRPTERWKVRITGQEAAFTGSVVFPIPPNDPGQNVISCTMRASIGQKQVTASAIQERNPLKQSVLRIDVEEASMVKVQVDIEVQFFDTFFGRATTTDAAHSLTKEELQVTLDCRWPGDNVKEWFGKYLDSSNLRVRKGESKLDFALRAHHFVGRNYRYEIPDKIPAYKKLIEEQKAFGNWLYVVSTRSGECWRISELYANILRSNGIPVRVISGNHVGAFNGHHLRVLVFDESVGWFPVEPTSALGAPDPSRFFGHWGGTMLNGNENIWLDIPALKGSLHAGTVDYVWFIPTKGEARMATGKLQGTRID